MMKKQIKTSIALFAIVAISLTSCKKGDTGPQGEKGATGAQGVQGSQGATGNANIVSGTVNLTSASWILSGAYWYSDAINTTLTQNNVDNAMVQIYLSNNVGGWIGLPITLTDIQIYTIYSLNKISFRVSSASGSTSVSNPGALTFKYVIIPPAMIKPNVNVNNYNDVVKAYDL